MSCEYDAVTSGSSSTAAAPSSARSRATSRAPSMANYPTSGRLPAIVERSRRRKRGQKASAFAVRPRQVQTAYGPHHQPHAEDDRHTAGGDHRRDVGGMLRDAGHV